MVWAPATRGLPDGIVYQIEIADIVALPTVAGASAAEPRGVAPASDNSSVNPH